MWRCADRPGELAHQDRRNVLPNPAILKSPSLPGI